MGTHLTTFGSLKHKPPTVLVGGKTKPKLNEQLVLEKDFIWKLKIQLTVISIHLGIVMIPTGFPVTTNPSFSR
jgi:hypothetical protein